jgi:signal transduction histidine kinase
MQGVTTLLLQNYAHNLDTTGEDFAQRISAAATRMDRLIADLLGYGRLSHQKLCPGKIDLGSALQRVLAQMSEEIQLRDAQIEVEHPLPAVWANATVVDEILTNLLTNALKYVEPGVAPKIRVWAQTLETKVRLWVEDNGIGIAPEHQERVFRVFERLEHSEKYPGTGIGLAIVAKGAERMGGRAGVESEIGKGSRFWLELPHA